jgi:hypothetical protein
MTYIRAWLDDVIHDTIYWWMIEYFKTLNAKLNLDFVLEF